MTRFLIKAIVNGIIVVAFLRLYTEATWFSSVMTALGLSVIAYFIGDQLILRATNNITATIADAAIAALYLWMVSYYFKWSLSLGELVIMVAVLGVAEFFYHRYLGNVDERTRTDA